MTPKKRAAKVVREYGYPELTQLTEMIASAITEAVQEAEARRTAIIKRLIAEKRELEDRIANALV